MALTSTEQLFIERLLYSVTRGKMRQRSIMRQLSCYGFQNQFGRDQFDQVCEIYIVSRKLGAILLNQQEEK